MHGNDLEQLRRRNAELEREISRLRDGSPESGHELRYLTQIRALAAAARSIMAAPDLSCTLNAITDAAREIIGAHQSVCSMTNGPDWSQAINAMSLSEDYAAWKNYDRMPNGSGIYAWICEGNRTVRMTQAELEAHPRWRGFGSHVGEHPPMRGWLATALVANDGRNLGLIQLSHKVEGEFDEVDESIVVQLAQFAASAIERAQAEEALRASEARFRELADNISQFVWTADATGWIHWYNRRWHDYTGMSLEEMQGWGWRDVHHPDHIDRIIEEVQRNWERGEAWEGTYRLRSAEGEYRWFLTRAEPIRNEAGELVRWFGTNTDVTAQKQAEKHQRLLINELNHRVKNTLATVQSIASQTLRNAATPDQARRAMEERLFALSRAHDVLTRENWEGAELGEIVRQAVAPYSSPGEDRLHLRGPDVRIPPRMALALAMALQELATNAVKYGALSNASGEVVIAWEVQDGTLHRRLALHWREAGGPAVQEPARRGFGTRLIERSLAQDLDGEVRMAFDPTGLVCTVDAPIV